MNFDDVSYVVVPNDSECIVNAVQIGKQLDLAPHIIRSWADEFEEFLYVKKTNGRMTYTQKSVDQFEWIKAMRDKGYSFKHIHEQLKIKGFTYKNNDLGLINPNDVNLMESIKTDVGIEVKNQLKDFLIKFINAQKLENTNLVNSIKTEVEQTVQDQLEESMNDIEKELQSQKESNEKLSKQLTSVQQELAITKDTNKKLDKKLEEQSQQIQNNFEDMNSKIIEENKKIINEFKYIKLEQEQTQSKSFLDNLSNLFHKKK